MEQLRRGCGPLRVFAVLFALAAGGGSAAAQQGDAAAESASFRLPGWSFTPTLAIGAIHDSNVALTSPTADPEDRRGDGLFNIVPGGQLEFLGRRSELSLSYRGFLRRYFEVDALNGFDQRASVSARRAFTRRWTLYVQDSFADTPTTDEIELTGVPFRRTGSRLNTVAAGSIYRVSKFITLNTRYDATRVTFDRTETLLTGGWLQGLNNDLSYQLSQRLTVGGEYGYRRASLDQGNREIGFNNGGGVMSFALGPRTNVRAAGGFAQLQDRTAGESRMGPYVRFGLDQELNRGTVGASFERLYVPSFGFGGASNSQEVRVFLLMPVARSRAYTHSSFSWRRSVPFEEGILELDTVWLRSTIGYSAARWMRLEALYTFTLQDSIVTGGEVDRHRVGVQLVVSQPMRIQ